MAKAISKSRETSAELGRADDAFANAVGRLLRSARAKRGMTRRQLAEQSGASERYLAQIESGQGNPSVIVLKAIAEALDLSIIDLLPRTDGRSETLERIVDVLRRMPQSELPVIADLVEREYGASVPDLIEIAGIATFRRYERACLERVIGDHERAVIATAGGIVA